MAAVAAAQPIMDDITSVLKDETGNIPAERLMQLLFLLTKVATDTFISYFTQAMAALHECPYGCGRELVPKD